MTLKSATLAALAFAVLATSSAQAAVSSNLEIETPVASINLIDTDASNIGVEVAGYYGHYKKHYNHSVHCFWKKKKVWSNYHYGYIWKSVKICY
jgi:opacity protein-like surface antigen